MERLTLHFDRKNLALTFAGGLLLLLICFGFGYFFGRYEQIQINKSLLKVIPDTNCGVKAK